MTIKFSPSYYLAVCEASHTRCTNRERLEINRAMVKHLESAGMKRRYEFKCNPRGMKSANAMVEKMRAVLFDFSDFKKLVIEQSEGFNMLL